jgi:menaquinone-dependent protoporphyrinogen oxidase
MDIRVLVAYATKHGNTAEIAEKIGQVLREAGLRADVVPVARAGDPASYQAVVLGSGVYIGQWRKEAARYLKAHEAALAGRPVWLFSSGPTGEGDPVELLKGWRLPSGLVEVAGRIGVRDRAVFGGALDAAKMGALEKWMIRNVKAPLGDFRNWDAIAAWAAGIAEALKAPPA